ncbi:MAG: hypothetical protein WC082_06440 [Victivallales bacterium]
MNSQFKLIIMALFIVNIIGEGGTLFADEKNGRDLSGLFTELNQAVNSAKEKMVKLEAELPSHRPADFTDIFLVRAEVLKEFNELNKKSRREPSPAVRERLLKEMRERNLQIMKFNTFFFEFMKNDLKVWDKRLEILEKSLPGIIAETDRIKELTDKVDMALYPEQSEYIVHKNLREFAKAVEKFSAKYPGGSGDIIRRSVLLQDNILRRSRTAGEKVRILFSVWNILWKQLLIEATAARCALQKEKEILEQVRLCEKVDSISREAGILDLSNNGYF